jgi:hypothetical protein
VNRIRNLANATALTIFCLLQASCGNAFNPAFLNTLSGGVYPVTPGPRANFVLVRCVNETPDVAEFIVTIEREDFTLDEEGNPAFDGAGNPITQLARETVRLTTFPVGRANELGVVFPCDISPIVRIGLGENLLPTDAAVFIGGEGPAGAPGFGISAEGLFPLALGNFNCGDTVIFRAIESIGVPGGVALRSFLFPGSEQPSVFSGRNTFVNLEIYLDTQEAADP